MSVLSANPSAAPGAHAPGAVPGRAAQARSRQIAASGLTKSFRANGGAILDRAGFTLNEGESLAVIGPNGSGKSTMLRCCLRLVEPDSGTITIHGTEITALRPAQLRRLRAGVGFVFQRHNLVPRISVLSNVLHGAQARGHNPLHWFQRTAPRHLREEALHCLACVGLADLAHRRSDQLSGGQSQRVAIARTLMQRPRLVFADEPAASLDPSAGEEVMELFARLMREEGVGIVFTCHDLSHAQAYGDRVLALKHGRVVFDEPVGAVDFSRMRHLYTNEAANG